MVSRFRFEDGYGVGDILRGAIGTLLGSRDLSHGAESAPVREHYRRGERRDSGLGLEYRLVSYAGATDLSTLTFEG